MINQWIKKNQLILLNKIFKIYVNNNCFILNLLSLYKSKVPLLSIQLNNIINKEKKKLIINKSNYEEALHNNYEAINILYNYDFRDKNTVLRELFSLLHYEEKNYNNGKKLVFIKKINQNQLKINVNKIFLDNVYYSEEREKKLLYYVNNNNIIELKSYLKTNELSLIYYSYDEFDFLIYAIENKISYEMVKFIISQYSSLNYSIKDSKLKYKSPLLSAIINSSFRVFKLLTK